MTQAALAVIREKNKEYLAKTEEGRGFRVLNGYKGPVMQVVNLWEARKMVAAGDHSPQRAPGFIVRPDMTNQEFEAAVEACIARH